MPNTIAVPPAKDVDPLKSEERACIGTVAFMTFPLAAFPPFNAKYRRGNATTSLGHALTIVTTLMGVVPTRLVHEVDVVMIATIYVIVVTMMMMKTPGL